MPKVIIKFNAAVISTIDLTKEETTFGRKKGNDIVIDNPAVSGFHGKFVKKGDDYFVEDLNSTNGTFINGRKIKSSKMSSGDTVRVAKHSIEFTTQDTPVAPSPAPPEPAAPSVQVPQGPPLVQQNSNPSEDFSAAMPAAAAPKKPAPVPPTGAGAPGAPKGPGGKPPSGHAVLKIVSGAAGVQTEFPLTGLVTYIGSSDQAVVKIKGFLAPSLAAAISRRPEGYFLKAVKPGYPKVNGNAVETQTLLESGALIECGGTNMVFYHTEDKKPKENQGVGF